MPRRPDGSFKIDELTTDELVELINRAESTAWQIPQVLEELCKRADCYYEAGQRLDDLTIEQIDEIMYELGYEPDDEGTYLHILGLTDAEVDEWMRSIETGISRGEVVS